MDGVRFCHRCLVEYTDTHTCKMGFAAEQVLTVSRGYWWYGFLTGLVTGCAIGVLAGVFWR